MDGMQTKIAGPSSFTRLGTGTRAKRPLVVELPRKVNRRWTTSSPETGCKGPAIVEIDRSLRQQKPKRRKEPILLTHNRSARRGRKRPWEPKAESNRRGVEGTRVLGQMGPDSYSAT